MSGTALGTGLGQPSPDPDVLAIDEDLFPGGRCPALTVKEQLEDLDGLSERAARGADLRSGAVGWSESDTRQQSLLGRVQSGEAGQLPLQPSADLDAVDHRVRAQGGDVVSGLRVGAQEVVFAVPVRAVGQTPVWIDSGQV